MFGNSYLTFSRLLSASLLFSAASSLCVAQTTKKVAPKVESQESAGLPKVDQLVDAKLNAVSQGISELEALIIQAEKEVAKEQAVENHVFDSTSYWSLSAKNTAPSSDYRLESTEFYIDGAKAPLAQGGVHNQGMPRKHELYFGKIPPGCHEIKVKARYIRLKNDLISRFLMKREVNIEAHQAFIATSGYRVEIEVEGYEARNTFASFYRGPAIRFNKSARPNFLLGAPILSMDDVLKEGRVQINYTTEDNSNHILRDKSLSIDGLPVLGQKLQQAKDGELIFDAPLAEGKHRLSATLVFAQKKWVKGGQSYNFRLKFEHDFYVRSGQTTLVDLRGMPEGGIKSSLSETRYAKTTSRILSTDYSEFFPEQRCSQIKTVAKEAPAKDEKLNGKEPAEGEKVLPVLEPVTGE